MPITNIVDYRMNRYNVNCSVIFEDSSYSNRCQDATQFEEKDVLMYLGIRETDIKSAIGYINQEYPCDAITMFLYDPGTNYHDYLTIFQDDDKRYYLVEKKISTEIRLQTGILNLL